jgi:hypothetical protein
MMGFLAFIPPKVWIYLAGLAVAAGVVAGAYFKGRLDQSKLCRDRDLTTRIIELERDLQAQQTADALEVEQLKKLEKLADDYEAEIAAYEVELEAQPVDSRCILTDRDIRGLRDGK